MGVGKIGGMQIEKNWGEVIPGDFSDWSLYTWKSPDFLFSDQDEETSAHISYHGKKASIFVPTSPKDPLLLEWSNNNHASFLSKELCFSQKIFKIINPDW